MRRKLAAIGVLGLVIALTGVLAPAQARIDVTVHEGTSMSVAVSPDGRTLAVDLQGSIWTLPATGGTATRITDIFNDARQPSFSPDGRWIAFFAYRDGGYDIWAIAPDGSSQHKLTWGAFDDREPIWSHDGTRVAFSSDRGNSLGGDYNIWTLDMRSGEFRQLTKNPADDYMPTWSPDDKEIAFASTRDDGQSVWAVSVVDGTERKVASAAGRVDAPSWGGGGQVVYHVTTGAGRDGRSGGPETSRYEVGGKVITGTENVFAFRASWADPKTFYYVSDGKIRKRSADGGAPQTVEFSATLQVTRAAMTYTRRRRDFTSVTPRQVLGVVSPKISPDGKQVAFAALGDIYVMPVDGKPVNLTGDAALDTDPAWSPDGSQLAYSSDKGSEHLQLWVRDMKSGRSRRLTELTTQPQGAAWSPDGSRIAFFNVNGMWRVAQMSVVDVATGKVTKVHDTLPQPGAPAWSPDGKRLAIAGIAPMTKRFREGTNQILTMSSTALNDDRWFAPQPMMSIDSRGGCGPAWSPDGTKMAAIYEGVLAIWPVSPSGEPLGPPRRITNESAHAPSWAGDSRHILYQAMDKLRIVDVETGDVRTVPLDLKYTPAIPTSHLVVHAGKLVDMKSAASRADVDIVITGNKITSVVPHAEANHTGQVVDASNLTVMPGLIEFHSHLQPDFGESAGRAWLAFGVTTVRSPGNTPYEPVEEREASEANVRIGPRVYGTGNLMEWQRVYYKMGIAISSVAHFEMELQRAKVLQYDLLKSYVRLPDLQQKRMVEFAHSIGIPVATHEIFPAAFVGVDNTEHTSATSRRGYSPKMATLQRSYEDVIQLFGKSGRYLTPTLFGAGRQVFEKDPALKDDPRFKLYPEWMQQQTAQMANPAAPNLGIDSSGNGKMVMDVMHAGGVIVAGTDTPNAINLHGELAAYVAAGMTPFEALKAATVNPAHALALDTGTIEAGKLADLVIVDGDPLVSVANAHKVRRVIANGRLYELEQLINRGTASKPPTQAVR
ncbi:MAG TPA: amidohydrolase family protein [Vicinamibacterales bacterium]|jgi:Tol biopolymer transport system component/imidazolonepropionase-like amidohydrolase|nr:amidohydrolase family protein [Vicinamibacterales bacterium]